ncbi:MAG: asparaginase [Gammaproteobacteria bacterium]|nr:asparaginase [Gammaproteobacteria bacterium]
MENLTNPVLVEVRRGSRVESRHRGCAVAVNAGGDVVFAAGDPSQAVYPRSALKWFQAIPLVESGAADEFALSDQEIALACASHNAEEFHTRAVNEWLRRLGFGTDDLECGAEWPMRARDAHALAARGESPTRAHHNCSGKHAGMLTLSRFLGAKLPGYCDYAHPTQQLWMRALSELAGVDVFSLDWERDGCGLPAVCMPLARLARAFAAYAEPQKSSAKSSAKNAGPRGEAMARIQAAVRAHPEMLAGSGRSCTDVPRVCGGQILLKAGAEGVCAGVIPHLQIGFALKIDDGADRARGVALGALLKKLGALESGWAEQLETHFCPAVVNSQGRVTGRVLPAENW